MRPQVHHLTQLIIALFWNIYYLSCGCPDNPLPSIQLVAPPFIAGNYPVVDEIEGGVVELLWKRGKAAVNLVCVAISSEPSLCGHFIQIQISPFSARFSPKNKS